MVHSYIIRLMPRYNACIASYLNIANKSTQGFTPTEQSFESTRGKDSIKSALNCSATISSTSWSLLVRFSECFRLQQLSILRSCACFPATKKVWQGEKVEDPHFTLNISSTSGRSTLLEVKSKRQKLWLSFVVVKLTPFKAAAGEGSKRSPTLRWWTRRTSTKKPSHLLINFQLHHIQIFLGV